MDAFSDMRYDDAPHGPKLTRRNVLAGAVALGGTALVRPGFARAATTRAGVSPAAAMPSTHGAVVRGMDITATLGRGREGRFGLMFKHLEAFTPPDELLVALARRMEEPAAAGADLDVEAIPSAYTYLGQFVVHDITFDRTPLTEQQADPHAVTNFDSARLDLAVIYGRGPAADPQLYVPGGAGRLRLEAPNGVADLPRRSDGSAWIGDPRNDENFIVCQLHIAFMAFHNRLMDAGASFSEAQRLTRWHYQWVVAHDLLERLVGRPTVESFFDTDKKGRKRFRRQFYKPKSPQRPMMPLEFSLAAFRFGHSMVRPRYSVNRRTTAPVFSDVAGEEDLRGGRPLPAALAIEWERFLPMPGRPAPVNFARRIDTRLARGLFHLPVPHVVPAGPAPIVSLAERNLLRGKRFGLPAGGDVARAMGVAPIGNTDLGLADGGWNGGAPLWFYVLAEAERQRQGRMLGDVGGRIVAEVILGLLDSDRDSFLNAARPFEPVPPVASGSRRPSLADIVAFARPA